MKYHWISNKSSKRGAATGAGNAYPSGVHELPPLFSGVRVA